MLSVEMTLFSFTYMFSCLIVGTTSIVTFEVILLAYSFPAFFITNVACFSPIGGKFKNGAIKYIQAN